MESGEAITFRWSAHLWVVVSDPKQNPDEVLLVNFSSVKPGVPCDPACIVKIGDHPYITAQSFVYYGYARIATNADLERQIASGQADAAAYPPVNTDLLDRIRKGAGTSRFIVRKHRQLLKDQGLI